MSGKLLKNMGGRTIVGLGLALSSTPALADDYTPLVVITLTVFSLPLAALVGLCWTNPTLGRALTIVFFCFGLVPMTIACVTGQLHPIFVVVPWLFAIMAYLVADTQIKAARARTDQADPADQTQPIVDNHKDRV